MEGLARSFEYLGQNIKDNISHIKAETTKREDPFIEKMKKWLLIGLTILVGGGAGMLVLIRIIKRLF